MNTQTCRRINSTIQCTLTATPAVILPARADRWLKVNLSKREMCVELVVISARANKAIENSTSCCSPIHANLVCQRICMWEWICQRVSESAKTVGRGVCILLAHPTSAINISPVALSKLKRHGLRNPIAQISFGVVPSILPKHAAFSTQGLSGGDAQLLETFTRSIFPISDLFVLNKKLGICIKTNWIVIVKENGVLTTILAAAGVNILAWAQWVVRTATISHTNIEVSIRSKLNRPSIMISVWLINSFKDSPTGCDVAWGWGYKMPCNYGTTACFFAVVYKEVSIIDKIWMKCESK